MVDPASNPDSGAVTVGETSITVSNLKARIQLSVGAAKYYNSGEQALSTKEPLFTTWGDVSGEDPVISPTAADNDTLITGALAQGENLAQVRLRELAAGEVGWIYFAISATLSDQTAAGDKGDNHAAVWAAAVRASSRGASFSFQRDTTYDPTNSGADDTKAALNNDELYYYTQTTSPTSYDKNSEAISNMGKASPTAETGNHVISVTAAELVDETEMTKVVGYLVVRLEGNTTTHTSGIDYSTKIKTVATLNNA